MSPFSPRRSGRSKIIRDDRLIPFRFKPPRTSFLRTALPDEPAGATGLHGTPYSGPASDSTGNGPHPPDTHTRHVGWRPYSPATVSGPHTQSPRHHPGPARLRRQPGCLGVRRTGLHVPGLYPRRAGHPGLWRNCGPGWMEQHGQTGAGRPRTGALATHPLSRHTHSRHGRKHGGRHSPASGRDRHAPYQQHDPACPCGARYRSALGEHSGWS